MLKFYGYAVTFAEFPEEISLLLNISNCPGTCSHCSEPELRQDIGTELTNNKIDELIKNNRGITLFGLMGGDSDHKDCVRIAKYIHEKYEIKVGMYSGKDTIDFDLLNCLDYYKIGHFIMPVGPVETWGQQQCGPLCFPQTNQVMLKKIKEGIFENITYKFQKEKINNPERFIIK